MATPEQFKQASDVLGLVSSLLDTVDWDDLAADMSRADALGPIVDPTAFARSIANGVAERNRKAIGATRRYLAELREIAPEVA